MIQGIDRLVGVDLDLFLALHLLLEEGSVTRAAERAGVSQPTMSRWLQAIRELTDDPILVREGRGMVPTTRAAAVRPQLAQALAGLDAVLEGRPFFDPAITQRTFTLAAGDFAAAGVIPPFLAYLRERAPTARLAVVPLGPRLDERLASGEVDIMVGQAGLVLDGVARRELARATLVGVARHDHPFVHDPPDLETWLDADHVVVDTILTPSSPVEDMLRQHGREHRILLHLPYQMAIPPVLASSDMVGAQMESTARPLQEAGVLATFPLPFETPETIFQYVWSAARSSDPALTWFRDVLEAFVVEAGVFPER